MLVTGGEDSSLKVWEEGALKNTLREHLGPIYAITTAEDSVFTGGAEGVLRKWTISGLLSESKPHF